MHPIKENETSEKKTEKKKKEKVEKKTQPPVEEAKVDVGRYILEKNYGQIFERLSLIAYYRKSPKFST